MRYEPNRLLGRLVGMRLLSVEFILDYLIIRFDGEAGEPQAVLTCEVLPTVEISPSISVGNGSPTYADALRHLIGGDVKATDEQDGKGLHIQLGTGTIVVNPDATDLVGPEIALLRFEDAEWMCWRPGEESFSHLA